MTIDPAVPPDERNVWLCFVVRIDGQILRGQWVDLSTSDVPALHLLTEGIGELVVTAVRKGHPVSIEVWDPDTSTSEPACSVPIASTAAPFPYVAMTFDP